jgi:hypothetical protein
VTTHPLFVPFDSAFYLVQNFAKMRRIKDEKQYFVTKFPFFLKNLQKNILRFFFWGHIWIMLLAW